MSVNYSSLFQNIADQHTHSLFSRPDLTPPQPLCQQINATINQIISACARHCSHLAQTMENSLSAMRKRVQDITQDNSVLREQYLQVVSESDELRQNYDRLKVEAAEKDEHVRELVRQMAEIRKYMKDLQDLKQDEEVINFDEGEVSQRFDTLQTIKEVSEHDLSVSMSIESLRSIQMSNDTSNQDYCGGGNLELTPKLMKNEDYEVDNYQDALSILKNYTAGATMVMSRNNKIDFSEVKQNIPSLADSNVPEPPEAKPVKNCTMDKIKKMRRIQGLELESGYVFKSDKQPFAVIKTNSQDSINTEQRDEVQSRLSYGPESGRTSDRSSVASTRIRSQDIISLEQPVKAVNTVIEYINSAYRYSHKIQKIQPHICKIDFAGGMHYHGGCDNKDLPSGFGKLYLNGQIVYQGEWRMGKMHGWGKLVLLAFVKDREREILQVDGNFRGGQVEGTVVCVFNTGEKFMGMIKGGSIEHEGTFVSEKGILTGHWEGSCLVLLI